MNGADAAPDRTRSGGLRKALLAKFFVLALCTISCGKEGPPLPPLVRLPAPPGELTAVRRGSSVDVRFVVPSTNTDGSRPADVERVDVYALTGPATATDDQLVKQATRIGSVTVKAPRDPDATVDPDEPVSDVEAPEGPGIDQGAAAALAEQLTPRAFERVELSSERGRRPAVAPAPQPLAGPPFGPPTRIYASVGVSTRGRRGPFSVRMPVPLVAPPAPVSAVKIAYDENTISLTWEGLPTRRPVLEAASGDALPARIVGLAFPTTAYHVYEIRQPSEGERAPAEVRLTNPPTEQARFEDKQIAWNVERCFRVRAIQIYDRLTLEGESSPDACITVVDTFPPKPPTNVQVVPSEGAISLIWQRGDEKDLAGFIVLRGSPPSETMTAVTPAPIQETAFVDKVAAGVRYVYAVLAVDTAGNRSGPSSRSEVTEAR